MKYIRLVITFFILLVLLKIIYGQFLLYPADQKYIFMFLCFLLLLALYYESMENGCGILDCTDGSVQQNIDDKELACRETDRVCWRRSLILSFIILVISNAINPNYGKNLSIFFFVWAILYFYFNFDQFHRYRVMCKYHKI
jgi:hypothetical protein